MAESIHDWFADPGNARLCERLRNAGVRTEMEKAAQSSAAQTLAGAARMVLELGEHPGLLKDRVASPGGTTITGLSLLEQGRLRWTLMSAVEAATQRSHELGKAESHHL